MRNEELYSVFKEHKFFLRSVIQLYIISHFSFLIPHSSFLTDLKCSKRKRLDNCQDSCITLQGKGRRAGRSRPAARVSFLLLRLNGKDYLLLTIPSIQSLMVPDTEAQ